MEKQLEAVCLRNQKAVGNTYRCHNLFLIDALALEKIVNCLEKFLR
jgi:hypothetical protein